MQGNHTGTEARGSAYGQANNAGERDPVSAEQSCNTFSEMQKDPSSLIDTVGSHCRLVKGGFLSGYDWRRFACHFVFE